MKKLVFIFLMLLSAFSGFAHSEVNQKEMLPPPSEQKQGAFPSDDFHDTTSLFVSEIGKHMVILQDKEKKNG